MSRTLFDQSLAPRPRNRKSIGTVSVSVLLHAGALAVVLALQFTSQTQLIVASPLPAFVAPPPTPPPVVTPPAPRRAIAPTPAPSVTPVPMEEPNTFTQEPVTVSGPPTPTLSLGKMDGQFGLSTLPGSTTVVTSTPPPPPRQSVVRVGGDVLAPTRVYYVPPSYPSLAMTAKIEGEVTLEATIDEAGIVRNVAVLKSVPLLDRAAIEAVSKWRYSPTRLNGQPVAVIMLVRVKFTLK